MSRTRLSLVVALLAVGLVLAGLLPCQAAGMSKAEKKIEEALDSPTQLEFIECPLQDVIDYLKDYHEIEIQIDARALQDVGIGTDTPITRNLKGVSLRSALTLMLRELDLTFLIENEVLMITTPEEAECRLTTKIYPVGDVITRADVAAFDAPDQGGESADYDSLIEMITSTIEPVSWADVGGPGSIAPMTVRGTEILVIAQTYQIHRKIAALLAELREVAGAKPTAKGVKPSAEDKPVGDRPAARSTPEKPSADVADPFSQ
ncbi:MAG TPA: hypothetical protein VMY42_02920 [Thermoguttaceae bacterium]|nr:hypothetical protein [Thermoguttaceae bacterium]